MGATTVFIEVLDKKETAAPLHKHIRRGLLASAFHEGTSYCRFLAMYYFAEKNKKRLDIFNLAYYNISMIEVVRENKTTFYSFEDNERDQARAFNRLQVVFREVVPKGAEMIALNTYSKQTCSASVNMVKGNHVDAPTYGARKTPVRTQTVTHASGNVSRHTSIGFASANTPPKPPEFKVFKGRGRSRNLLEKMLAMVKDENYKSENLEKLSAAIEAEEVEDEYEDQFQYNGPYL